MIQVTQNRDDDIVAIKLRLEMEEVEGLELVYGIVFRKDRMGNLLFYVPHELEENVIRLIQEKICHLVIDKNI